MHKVLYTKQRRVYDYTVTVTWVEGKLQLGPESIEERDALLLLWESTRRTTREGPIIVTDFGARFDGSTNDAIPCAVAVRAASIEEQAHR